MGFHAERVNNKSAGQITKPAMPAGRFEESARLSQKSLRNSKKHNDKKITTEYAVERLGTSSTLFSSFYKKMHNSDRNQESYK